MPLQRVNLRRLTKERFISLPRLLIKGDLLSYPAKFLFHFLLIHQGAQNEVESSSGAWPEHRLSDLMSCRAPIGSGSNTGLGKAKREICS